MTSIDFCWNEAIGTEVHNNAFISILCFVNVTDQFLENFQEFEDIQRTTNICSMHAFETNHRKQFLLFLVFPLVVFLLWLLTNS